MTKTLFCIKNNIDINRKDTTYIKVHWPPSGLLISFTFPSHHAHSIMSGKSTNEFLTVRSDVNVTKNLWHLREWEYEQRIRTTVNVTFNDKMSQELISLLLDWVPCRFENKSQERKPHDRTANVWTGTAVSTKKWIEYNKN